MIDAIDIDNIPNLTNEELVFKFGLVESYFNELLVERDRCVPRSKEYNEYVAIIGNIKDATPLLKEEILKRLNKA